MGRWRGTAAIAALGALSLAAAAAASSTSPRLYTVGATKACLENVPHAIDGLPPATPPSPPARFVSELPRYRSPRAASGQLGVWYGYRTRGTYAGAILTFFKSVPAARAYFKALLLARSRMRNVVVEWDDATGSEPGWQEAVRGCLRTASPIGGTPSPKRSIPPASLATFAGYWGGHTRGLRISVGGRGVEYTGDGCCVRVYRSTIQILAVSGTLTRATATYRVISSTRYVEYSPRLRVGQLGKLRLRNGIVTNTLTRVFFCSGPAWWATGACGA